MDELYFLCDWRHPPNADPVRIYYEVTGDGRVSRLIDVFADGRRECASLADYLGREDELPGPRTLVEGQFHDAAANLIQGHVIVAGEERLSLAPIDREAFEAEWR
jgi:hypothetical protein